VTKDEICDIRNALGLTQEKFGQLLGVHPMTVSKWERGELEPTAYQLGFLEKFEKAAKDKKTREKVAAALVIGGFIAAIVILLSASKKGK
jgi:putative transcriptional regulator